MIHFQHNFLKIPQIMQLEDKFMLNNRATKELFQSSVDITNKNYSLMCIKTQKFPIQCHTHTSTRIRTQCTVCFHLGF